MTTFDNLMEALLNMPEQNQAKFLNKLDLINQDKEKCEELKKQLDLIEESKDEKPKY